MLQKEDTGHSMKYIKSAVKKMMNVVASCMMPVIPVLVAGGFLKMIVAIADTVFNVSGGTMLSLISCLSDAPFYFMPIIVAYAAGKYFNVPAVSCLMTVSALVVPSFVDLMSSGEALYLGAIPVYQTEYAYAVIPIIVLVYFMSWVNAVLDRHLPDKIKELLQTTILTAISYIVGVVVICPAAAFVGDYLFNAIGYLQRSFPVIAWCLLNFLWPVLIITGMHWIFITMAITSLGNLGIENGVMMVCFISAMTLTAAALTVFIKANNSDRKITAASIAMANIWSGAAEPCIYGICLPNHLLLAACMIGNAAAGIFQGITGITGHIYSFPSIFSIFMFADPNNPQNIINACIAGAIGFAVTFIIAMCCYKEPVEQNKRFVAEKCS